MPIVYHKQFFEASVEECFNLARSVDIHTKTTANTKERVVGGVTHGLLNEGDTVTWEATHFGIKTKANCKSNSYE